MLDHRREKAGNLYRVFEGEAGYRAPESKADFCKRQSPEIKRGPARPEQMPFYVLLVGSPEEIPYEFQFQLDVMRGVGRLDFGNDLEAYARYAQNVVAAETGAVKLPRKAAFFSVRNPGDDATLISDRYLVRPLLANLRQPKLQGEIPLKFEWDLSLAPSGEKAELARLLSGKEQTPALLFTASHGMVFPSAQKQQSREQGALLCQHWARGAPLVRDDYFAAEDLGDANLLGLVALFFACFGVGTPQVRLFRASTRDDPDAHRAAQLHQRAAEPDAAPGGAGGHRARGSGVGTFVHLAGQQRRNRGVCHRDAQAAQRRSRRSGDRSELQPEVRRYDHHAQRHASAVAVEPGLSQR